MIYLASQSPRRAELLRQIGVEFKVYATDIDERVNVGESPEEYVSRLAQSKARVAAAEIGKSHSDWVVLAADTTIAIDGDIIGKPEDAAHCHCILRRLSGREHTVLTAVAVATRDRLECRLTRNRVTFRALAEHEVQAIVRLQSRWTRRAHTLYRVRQRFLLSDWKVAIRRSWVCRYARRLNYCRMPG